MYDGTSAVAGVRKARQDRHGSGSSTAAATFALETDDSAAVADLHFSSFHFHKQDQTF